MMVVLNAKVYPMKNGGTDEVIDFDKWGVSLFQHGKKDHEAFFIGVTFWKYGFGIDRDWMPFNDTYSPYYLYWEYRTKGVRGFQQKKFPKPRPKKA